MGGLGAAASYAGLWAAGAHEPGAMAAVTALGFAVPAASQWSSHRGAMDEARLRTQRSRDLEGLDRRRRGGAEAMRRIAEALDDIGAAQGRERDVLRGELMSMVVSSLGRSLPEGTAVALYRQVNGQLEPSGLQVGWTLRPRPIPLEGAFGELIAHLVCERSVEHRATRGGRDQVIAPIRCGTAALGVIVVDGQSDVMFDDADVDLVRACADLVGTAYADRLKVSGDTG